MHQAIQRASDGKLDLPVQDRDAEKMRHELRASSKRRDYAILSAAIVLSGILWFALAEEPFWPGIVVTTGGLLVFWRTRR
jgi:hypothetical protein